MICCVLRKNEAYIPKGDFVLQAGDKVCLTAHNDEIAQFFKAIGAYKHPVRDVLIVGGSRMTYYLLTFLQKNKIRATVIEPDKQRCRLLAEQFDCNVIHDDGTKQKRQRKETSMRSAAESAARVVRDSRLRREAAAKTFILAGLMKTDAAVADR